MREPERDPGPPPPASLVSRPLAAAVLVVLLVAGALSAWLVLHADLESARPPIPRPASGAPPTP